MLGVGGVALGVPGIGMLQAASQCPELQQLLWNVHSLLELCPGSGKLILNDAAWESACAELPKSQPRCPAWEREDAHADPGAAALVVAAPRCPRGFVPLEA